MQPFFAMPHPPAFSFLEVLGSAVGVDSLVLSVQIKIPWSVKNSQHPSQLPTFVFPTLHF